MDITPGTHRSVTLSLCRLRGRVLSESTIIVCRESLIQEVQRRLIDPQGAVYVQIPETLLVHFIDLLLSLSFQFHHYQTGVYTYYQWQVRDSFGKLIPDKVPPYATSIEGVGAIIISPDQLRVLLVWEYGSWKGVSGGLRPGESLIDTLKREVQEEVSVTLDEDHLIYLGGWHIAKARHGRVNDNFHAFEVRARSDEFRVDGDEIKEARWFDIDTLIKVAQFPTDLSNPITAKISAYDTMFSWITLQWLCRRHPELHIYNEGKYELFY